MKLSDKDKWSKLVVVDSSIRTPHINSYLSVCIFQKKELFLSLLSVLQTQIREKYGGKKSIYTDGVLNGIYRCM
jgi:hypothetical protein